MSDSSTNKETIEEVKPLHSRKAKLERVSRSIVEPKKAKKQLKKRNINKRDITVPEEVIRKWQSIVNVMAEFIHVPAALIMKVDPPYIEVFRSSKSSNNPYKVGDREHLAGLYCERVIRTRDKLLVPNALKDRHWGKNPDIKLGMISYLGFPLLWPDGEVFGTICVLDLKENRYSKAHKELMLQFKELVEAHLGLLYENRELEKIITERKLVQRKLLTYQKRLRDLASEMSLTEERERRRIAIELHDQITQKLIFFKINIGALREKKLPAGLIKPLNEIYEYLDEMIQDMRSLTFDLGCPTLYELGFEAAVREWLNEEIRRKYGIKTKFESDAQPKPLDDDVCALLYRAMRELLINVVKHAQAQHVKVSICRDNSNIRINVIDDGVGFKPPTEVFGLGKMAGFGLFSIRERISYFGGGIEIESEPGHGTRVTLVAPIKCGKTD